MYSIVVRLPGETEEEAVVIDERETPEDAEGSCWDAAWVLGGRIKDVRVFDESGEVNLTVTASEVSSRRHWYLNRFSDSLGAKAKELREGKDAGIRNE